MKINNESLTSIKKQIRNYTIDPENHLAVTTVTVTTARELSRSEYGNIAASLSKKFGGEVFLEKVVKPEIIGGIIVQYGDNIVDGSVVRQLKQYKDMMAGIDVKKIGVTDAV